MKALASVLLAFALAATVSNEAGAHRCSTGKNSTKHVTKTSVKHQGRTAASVSKTNQNSCVCSAEKSLLVLTGRLTELNSRPTNCVCRAEVNKTKAVASTGTMKAKPMASSGIMKTKSYGGYKPVGKPLMNAKNHLDKASGDFDSSKLMPLQGGKIDRGL